MNHLTKKTTISDLRKWSKNGETRKYGKSEGAFTSAVHRGNFTLGIWEIGREKKKYHRRTGRRRKYPLHHFPVSIVDSRLHYGAPNFTTIHSVAPPEGPELVPESQRKWLETGKRRMMEGFWTSGSLYHNLRSVLFGTTVGKGTLVIHD